MKLSESLRTVLAGVGSLALVAVMVTGVRGTVVAYRGGDSAVAHAAAVEGADSCAACPLAGTEECASCAAESSKPHVDTEKCVGCTKCVKVAPEAFEMDAETQKASIKDGAPKDAIARGAEVCPVGAVVK